GPLIACLSDPDPTLRAACAWALGRYETDAARDALHERVQVEPDTTVRREIEQALSRR
ncbi:MAG: HEAT repeat domain-containing protein, partial [Pirellulales bacterium]|nr:HEAT repeat domain-containing protein [Pirellulales bacterium]